MAACTAQIMNTTEPPVGEPGQRAQFRPIDKPLSLAQSGQGIGGWADREEQVVIAQTHGRNQRG